MFRLLLHQCAAVGSNQGLLSAFEAFVQGFTPGMRLAIQLTNSRPPETIKEEKLNRVVVGGCSPRTHEPIFQEVVRKAGLNKYLLEIANIRDQAAWVHANNPEKATAKAKDLIRSCL